MTLGVARSPHATNVADRLLAVAERLGVPARVIDLPSLGLSVQPHGDVTVADERGPVAVSSLAPYLLFGFPAAVHALRALERGGYAQNPVDGVLRADDKAATAQCLAQAGVAQVRTEICGADPGRVAAAAARIGYPVVVPAEVTESAGRSVRAVITGGQLLAVTERAAAAREWRSNIAGGAAQHRVELTGDERELVLSAARAVGLGHAGVDLLRTRHGPRVLEVNSCPDFTSMQPHYGEDLAEAVLRASLTRPAPL